MGYSYANNHKLWNQMSSIPQGSNDEPLSKTVKNLIHSEYYGPYGDQLSKLIGGANKVPPDTAHLQIDLQPLVYGNDEARQREVEKLAELSRYVKNPELMKSAKRLQGLTALLDVIDANFNQLCERFAPQNSDALNQVARAYFAPRMRQILMPDSIQANPQPSEMVADIERREALSDELYKQSSPTSVPLRSVFTNQRVQDLEKDFEAMVRNISGLEAARGKQR